MWDRMDISIAWGGKKWYFNRLNDVMQQDPKFGVNITLCVVAFYSHKHQWVTVCKARPCTHEFG